LADWSFDVKTFAPRPRCSRTSDADRLIGDLVASTIRDGSTFSTPRVIANDSRDSAPIKDQTSRQGANSWERKINSVEAR